MVFAVSVEDPDGNEWEVFVVKADADHMSDEPAESLPVARPRPRTATAYQLARATYQLARATGAHGRSP